MSTEANIDARPELPARRTTVGASPVSFDTIYGDLARLAARVCEAPFASIALTGATATWCSPHAVLPAAVTRGDPFPEHAARSGAIFEVADVLLNEHFRAADFAVNGLRVRSYGGCALRTEDGETIGTLGVYNTVARQLTAEQRSSLMLVARQVLLQTELRGRLVELELLSNARPGTPANTAEAAMVRSLVDSAPVAIYHTDATSSLTYANPEYRRIFGLSPEQTVDDWVKAVHEADRARIVELWGDFCRQPRPMKFEYRLQAKDGIDRYVCEEVVPLEGVSGFVGTISDFTDVVAARKTETLFLNTFDQAPVGIAFAGRDGQFQRCNPASCALLGFGINELADRSAMALTHADDAASSAQELRRLWNGEIDSVDLEKRYMRKDGSSVWVRATTALVRNADGTPECSVEFLRDISNRKNLAAALLQQQTLLESVITDLPVALVACDTAGQITHFNRAAVELNCIQASGPLAAATYLADGVTPLREAERPLARALRGENISNLELVILSDGSTPRTTLTSARRLISPAGETLGAVAVVQDTTERKHADLELERVNKELITASRQAGMAEVATNVLHNVGNILNSVNISASLVAERVKQSKASGLSRIATLLQEQGPRLGEFITNDERGKHIPRYLGTLGEQLMADQHMTLQELASLRENLEHIKDTVAMQQSYAKRCGVTETVEVVDLVEDSLRLNAGAFARHGVTLQREFSAVPPITVDKHKVLQILVNLVRNAKYACDESGRTDKLLTLRVEPAAQGVRISVIDNGVGIPPENMPRLFSHGFTTRKSGHGFGLHSGALAAQDLGGTLRAESDGPGRGATFILELPLAP